MPDRDVLATQARAELGLDLEPERIERGFVLRFDLDSKGCERVDVSAQRSSEDHAFRVSESGMELPPARDL